MSYMKIMTLLMFLSGTGEDVYFSVRGNGFNVTPRIGQRSLCVVDRGLDSRGSHSHLGEIIYTGGKTKKRLERPLQSG
ncbi:hypothetical protein J4Q44_G00074180, partial [Coregonus suidteri]